MGSHIGLKNGIENKDKEIKPRLKKDKIKCKKNARSSRLLSFKRSVFFFFLLGWDRPDKDEKK